MLCEKELMGGKGVTESGGLWSPEEGAWRRKERYRERNKIKRLNSSIRSQGLM